MKPVLHVGIDIGSTTVKVAALSPYLKLVFGRYARHMSDIRHATEALLSELQQTFPGYRITASVSGSGGMGLSQLMGLPFCQEILAETKIGLDNDTFENTRKSMFFEQRTSRYCTKN